MGRNREMESLLNEESERDHKKMKKLLLEGQYLQEHTFCLCGRLTLKHSVYESDVFRWGGNISRDGGYSTIIVISESKEVRDFTSNKFKKARESAKIIIRESSLQLILECVGYHSRNISDIVYFVKNDQLYIPEMRQDIDYLDTVESLREKFLLYYQKVGFYV